MAMVALVLLSVAVVSVLFRKGVRVDGAVSNAINQWIAVLPAMWLEFSQYATARHGRHCLVFADPEVDDAVC